MEPLADPQIPLLGLRLITLSSALLAGVIIGEPIARALQLPRFLTLVAHLARRLGEKLNKRDAKTRAWRGLVVLGMLMLPAVALGLFLGPHPWAQGLVLVLITGLAATPYSSLQQRMRLSEGNLTLQSNEAGFLFADTHGLLRHSVLGQAHAMGVGIIGVGVWYLIGGLGAVAVYLTLALAEAHYTPALAKNLAFGTPARILFDTMDALPRTLHAFLLLSAGVMIPGAHPMPAGRFFFSDRALLLATLLDIALGGRMPTAAGTRHVGWTGQGTARLDARHLTRWLMVAGVSLLLWLLGLLILLQTFVL